MPYTSRRELTMPIPRYIADGLDPHARRRNITTQEMVRRILAQAIRDNIVDAIMDDENSAPQRNKGPMVGTPAEADHS